jgi:hypothetical protein
VYDFTPGAKIGAADRISSASTRAAWQQNPHSSMPGRTEIHRAKPSGSCSQNPGSLTRASNPSATARPLGPISGSDCSRRLRLLTGPVHPEGRPKRKTSPVLLRMPQPAMTVADVGQLQFAQLADPDAVKAQQGSDGGPRRPGRVQLCPQGGQVERRRNAELGCEDVDPERRVAEHEPGGFECPEDRAQSLDRGGALWSLDAGWRTITCRLVEVKCHNAVRGVSAFEELKDRIAAQLRRSESVLAAHFDPARELADRPDRTVRNAELAQLLGFYLGRAVRHGTMRADAAAEAEWLPGNLDSGGYRLHFTRTG